MSTTDRATLTGFALLMALCSTSCLRGKGVSPEVRPLEWHSVPQEPGQGDTLAAVRLVRRTLGTSPPPIVEAYARVPIGGRSFLVVQAESTHGTGFYQTAFYVFSGDEADSRVVLTALASERATPNRLMGTAGYRIRGCLLSAGPDALAYQAQSSDPRQQTADSEAIEVRGSPAAHAPGIYRWSPADSVFAFARATGAERTPACSP